MTLAVIFIMIYAVSVAATQNDQNIIEKLIDGLFSGEVMAISLAGIAGYFINRARVEGDKRKEETVELGRLRFKQENYQATKEAVTEGMGLLHSKIQPRLEQIDDALDDLRIRIERLENKADEALRKSELLEKTQAAWITLAEEKISSVISCETGKPTLARNLFQRPEDDNDTIHR